MRRYVNCNALHPALIRLGYAASCVPPSVAWGRGIRARNIARAAQAARRRERQMRSA